ncbi:PQQ-dependent sugar dehydrogenase [Pseudovibrio sp. SPO723]|uniref:PQQ-dependent sugar dehydrogenase n=1 Tax=Nesiotobacter zosterae TaxID=392721 RepID=UPI0029C1FE82|nr:PQQ-dependent sugar dehydrogenase [Pseudovibrio sp. SPO723]MDX5593429.1 PQQ-dependent sugar dehydrogenase [Pseudovibrio sp. SPO723]
MSFGHWRFITKHRAIKSVWAGALAVVAGFALSAVAGTAQAQTRIAPETVTSGLDHPWSVADLPGGGFLVTERDGALKHVTAEGEQSVVSGTPKVFASGQGGLLDVVLSPNFASDGQIFLSFSEPTSGGAGTSVYRATLERSGDGFQLRDGRVIFSGNNIYRGGRHFGSRLVFAPDGTLFMTLGDRGDRPSAQNTQNHAGSVLRLTIDGAPAPDNPFLGDSSYQPEMWSIGHRNPQSAALHPETGVLWTVEHGARGGDEINIPEAGKNYGWPVISYGRHYTGGRIGEGTTKTGMEQPIYFWDPSIAPSGMAFVTSNKYPDWNGNLLVGALRGRHLSNLSLDGTTVTGESRLLAELGERIRDVRQADDGFIYVLTDSSDGQLIRLLPQ